MKQKIYPYPFKLSITGDQIDGSLFNIPTYCRRNYKTTKCKEFYKKNCTTEGITECPYGFTVDVINIQGKLVIFTGLNIEQISDRKKIQKRITEKDFTPRIPLFQYRKSITEIISIANSHAEFYKHENERISKKDTYIDKIEILDNTFHELRKLNQQLKLQVENLIYKTNNFDWNAVDDIKYLSQNIFSSSQLISIRLNTYDFGVNPNLSLYEEKSPICVHKKFVKVAHCLREYSNHKQIRLQILGESYSSVMANDILELLPYLLLDNAIKYSLENKTVEIKFTEIDNNLKICIKSFSIRPHDHELNLLTQRGIRSKRVDKRIQGQGIGLYLANYICDLNNIDMEFRIGKERYFADDIPYSDFYVTLTFYNIIKDNNIDYTFEIE